MDENVDRLGVALAVWMDTVADVRPRSGRLLRRVATSRFGAACLLKMVARKAGG